MLELLSKGVFELKQHTRGKVNMGDIGKVVSLGQEQWGRQTVCEGLRHCR